MQHPSWPLRASPNGSLTHFGQILTKYHRDVSRRSLLIFLAAVVAIGLVLLIAFRTLGHSEKVVALPTPSLSAVPQPVYSEEPVATPTPQPTVAFDPAACRTDEVTIMLGPGDAASGHREMPFFLENTGSRSCVLSGYPDFAATDRSGAALRVFVEHGGTMMTTDPGVEALVLAPGDHALASLGWVAQAPATDPTRAVRVGWATRPGDELTWFDEDHVDITDLSTVYVTAWQLGDPYVLEQ